MSYDDLEAGPELDRLVLERVMRGAPSPADTRFSTSGPANQAMIDHLGREGYEYRLQNKGLRPPFVAWFGREGRAFEGSSRSQFAANCIAALKAVDYFDGVDRKGG